MGRTRADQSWQEPRRADVTARDADFDERRRKPGAGCGQSDVRAEHQRQTATGSRTVDRRYHRLRDLAKVDHQCSNLLLGGQRRADRS